MLTKRKAQMFYDIMVKRKKTQSEWEPLDILSEYISPLDTGVKKLSFRIIGVLSRSVLFKCIVCKELLIVYFCHQPVT